MLTKSIIAAGALLSMVAAVPMQQQNKRDVVWTTKVEEAVTTVDVTTTVWLEPGESPPTQATAAAQPHHVHHHGGHKGHKHPIPAEPSKHAVPNPQAPKPSPEAPTTPNVAPTPQTTQTPAASPAPEPAAASSANNPPSHPHHPHPNPPHQGGGSSGGSAPSGSSYVGELTYYTPGLGSCGMTNTTSEPIVAVAENMMTATGATNPNDNPYCKKWITISYNGKTTEAMIVDTCPGCSGKSLDLSPAVFKDLANESKGRLYNAKWWFNN